MTMADRLEDISLTIKRTKRSVAFILLGAAFFLFGEVHAFQKNTIDSLAFSVPDKTGQLILVTSSGWENSAGRLQRFEKHEGGWKKVGSEVTVALGKNGMAWGRGLHQVGSSPEKKEGDAKAPAGVFSLGTLWGYTNESPSVNGYPYRQATSRDYFVDDVKSADYNTWVSIPASQENNPKVLWGSVEKMKRSDHLYEYGIVINHNMGPAEKGKGSAIFFHVWRTPGAATLGCTAMSKENLLELMRWLDNTKNPLLIQVPRVELVNLK